MMSLRFDQEKKKREKNQDREKKGEIFFTHNYVLERRQERSLLAKPSVRSNRFLQSCKLVSYRASTIAVHHIPPRRSSIIR